MSLVSALRQEMTVHGVLRADDSWLDNLRRRRGYGSAHSTVKKKSGELARKMETIVTAHSLGTIQSTGTQAERCGDC